jgi:hypothetical protein
MKCENCRYAKPLPEPWSNEQFLRCDVPEHSEVIAVTAKSAVCSFNPPKWEPQK